jgi:hypothetical protein
LADLPPPPPDLDLDPDQDPHQDFELDPDPAADPHQNNADMLSSTFCFISISGTTYRQPWEFLGIRRVDHGTVYW